MRNSIIAIIRRVNKKRYGKIYLALKWFCVVDDCGLKHRALTHVGRLAQVKDFLAADLIPKNKRSRTNSAPTSEPCTYIHIKKKKTKTTPRRNDDCKTSPSPLFTHNQALSRHDIYIMYFALARTHPVLFALRYVQRKLRFVRREEQARALFGFWHSRIRDSPFLYNPLSSRNVLV